MSTEFRQVLDNMLELLNCAHCGSSGHLLQQQSAGFPFRVSCIAKFCAVSTPSFATADVAVTVWNRRVLTRRRPPHRSKKRHG